MLDLTQFEWGTVCTQTRAWAGATVVKPERSGMGEQGRSSPADEQGVDSHHFIPVSASKRCVTVGLRHPEGRALLWPLTQRPAVFVENLRPGPIGRLGSTARACSRPPARPDLSGCAALRSTRTCSSYRRAVTTGPSSIAESQVEQWSWYSTRVLGGTSDRGCQ